MNKEEFIESLKELNISITEDQLEKLEIYYSFLVEKNQVMNLTAITDKEEIYLKHFYDSLTLVKTIDLTKDLTVCDIGTGAGFPGIVLKIVFPNLKIVLIDALEKRVKFLQELIKKLGLTDIEAIHERAEEYSKKNIEKFDIITSRAVAKTNILLELGSNLTKINGYAIFLKGDVEKELKESSNAIKELGYKLIAKQEFLLPKENSKRTIVKLQKINKTNKKYPRDFAKIKKRPL